jgi:hypothetical protein
LLDETDSFLLYLVIGPAEEENSVVLELCSACVELGSRVVLVRAAELALTLSELVGKALELPEVDSSFVLVVLGSPNSVVLELCSACVELGSRVVLVRAAELALTLSELVGKALELPEVDSSFVLVVLGSSVGLLVSVTEVDCSVFELKLLFSMVKKSLPSLPVGKIFG